MNRRGPFFLAQTAIEDMVARGPGAVAQRWDRVRINGINIDWTEAEREGATQRLFHGAENGWLQAAADSQPKGKLGQVDEIADFIGLLRSERRGLARR